MCVASKPNQQATHLLCPRTKSHAVVSFFVSGSHLYSISWLWQGIKNAKQAKAIPNGIKVSWQLCLVLGINYVNPELSYLISAKQKVVYRYIV